MMEHTLFIRGLHEPCEKELFCKSDEFAKNYCDLLEKCKCVQDRTIRAETLMFLPLLADHVLREANHYIRLLQC